MLLSDLITAGLDRADRSAASFAQTTLVSYANASLGRLYGKLCSTYEDYNVTQVTFALPGGSVTGNQVTIGPNGTVATDFFQPRALWLQIGNSPAPFVTIPRLTSLAERNLYTYPQIVPVYGAIPSCWNLLGATLEVLPSNVAGATYVLSYVPILPTFAYGGAIDGPWLTVNGWQEFAVWDIAAKLLFKEESHDSFDRATAQANAMLQAVSIEAKPRDVSQPQSIADMNRVRNPWGGWGGGAGLPGQGWGGDGFGGGGIW